MSARVLPALAAALVLLAGGAEAKEGGRPRHPATVSGVVNLNQASSAQLDLLPGVSPKAAQAIVAYREKEHFGRVEDLVKVKGFGKKTFDKLKPHLAVSGESTLRRDKPAKAKRAPGEQAQGRTGRGGGRTTR